MVDGSTGRFSLEELATSATAALFEGHRHADADVTFFVTRTPPGREVGLHVHPYHEVFVLLEGTAVYTRGDESFEVGPDSVVVIPPHTPHGFRNSGDGPLLQLGIHERGTLEQTWLDDGDD
jgi:mannose-6-phosphate isomerase-like protein (cupin superfamily)